MAKSSYQQITPDLEAAYKKTLQSGDRYTFPRIIRKYPFVPRKRKNFLKRIEMLTDVAKAWNEFNQSVRDDWIAAAAANSQRGYTLFTQDEIFRMKYGIPGHADPSLLHQYKVGRIIILPGESSGLLGAFELGISLLGGGVYGIAAIRIVQLHPTNYYVQRKVVGTKSQYQPIQVQEIFSLPLTISISYRSYLEAAGPNPSAKFYAEVYHNYQGRTLTTILECTIDLNSDWTDLSATCSSVIGLAIGYNLYIDINDCTGELQFDNVRATHNLTNWVRDFRCNDIDKQFTRAFYQVPKNWSPEIIGDNSFYDSVYPT